MEASVMKLLLINIGEVISKENFMTVIKQNVYCLKEEVEVKYFLLHDIICNDFEWFILMFINVLNSDFTFTQRNETLRIKLLRLDISIMYVSCKNCFFFLIKDASQRKASRQKRKKFNVRIKTLYLNKPLGNSVLHLFNDLLLHMTTYHMAKKYVDNLHIV